MGSLVPFQDLNLPPDPLSIAIITPKLEPKLEPLDDYNDPSYFSSNPNPSTNPEAASAAAAENENENETETETESELNSLQGLFPVPERGSNNDDDNKNNINNAEDVYAEFFRISELFRSAFAKKKRCGGKGGGGGEEMEVLSPTGSSSLSIVPRDTDLVVSPSSSSAIVKRPRNHNIRSSEMVRVTSLSIEDQRYFRDLVRRTRMLYESLRNFSIQEEEREKKELGFGLGLGFARRARGDLKAGSVMKDRGLWLNRDKRIIGAIPGVYVGDVFFFRMELCVIGLHGQAQAGIDYVPVSQSSNGEPIATSIIVSGGYEDDEDGGDVIIYTGHGGQMRNSSRQCVHQKLEGGNLALERSMFYEIEIRVIRGIRHEGGGPTSKVYVYDGLYRVVDSWFDIGKSGFGVYKYKLVRMGDQPEMGSSIFRFAASLRANPLSVRPSGYLSLDMSTGKEMSPVSLFNDIDSNKEPLLFEYLVKPVYPLFAIPPVTNGRGCDCVSSCSDGCYCAEKNGGEFAYDNNGILLRGKPLIFECGRFCSCPPSCRNRVSQNGVRHRLEVFRSRETGWGVRPLDLIPAGAFICEYTGLVLTRQQAGIFTMNGDTLVYPSRFAERWVEWGDVSQVYPEVVRSMQPSIPPLEFAMDVSRMRNVACYFSHSSSPNVLVQYVLNDHDNISYPHLTLFAMENIPPFRELSLDYGVGDEWTGKLALCN